MGTTDKKIQKIAVRIQDKIIYAMGSQGNVHYVQDLLNRYHLKIEAILDNNKNKSGNSEFDICLPEAKLQPYSKDAIILIYSPGYWREMKKQLEGMGYKEGRQVFVVNPKVQSKCMTMQFVQGMQRILEGKKIYSQLKRLCKDDFEIIVLRGATGDVYLNGLFLMEYLNRDEKKDYIITGDSKGLKKVMQLFDLKQERVIPLTLEQTTSLIQFGIFRGYENTHIKNVFLWQRSLNFNRCRIRLSERFNFMDTYRYLIYHTAADFNGVVPKFRSSVNIQQLLKEKGLVEGRTVLFSPIAYSVANMPVWFWRKLNDELIKRGYCTCANLAPGNETQMYDFLTSVFVPIDSSVELLERCGAFVALRSGFCDIVSSAKCKKIILYPSDKPKFDDALHRCDLQFSGLNNMGLSKDAIEYESSAIDDILLPDDYEHTIDVEAELQMLLEEILKHFS